MQTSLNILPQFPILITVLSASSQELYHCFKENLKRQIMSKTLIKLEFGSFFKVIISSLRIFKLVLHGAIALLLEPVDLHFNCFK